MKYQLKNSPEGRVYKLVEVSNGFVRFDDGSVFSETDIIEKFKAVEIDYEGYQPDEYSSVWIDEDIPVSDRPIVINTAPTKNTVVIQNGQSIPLSTIEKARKFRLGQ